MAYILVAEDDELQADSMRVCLAGTAGLFGEADLGELAGKIERALMAGNASGEVRRLAEELLKAA